MAWTETVDFRGYSNSGKQGGIAVAALFLCTVATPTIAATPAGTNIVNTATLSWTSDGQPRTAASNIVTVTTAEILDVTIAADRTSVAAQPSDLVAVGFLVTNTGNGVEDFALTFTSDRASVAVTRVAIDSDNDGVYDAGDQLLASGVTLTLSLGQQQRVFVLVDGAQVSGPTNISATVMAKTGSGAPGTVFAGAGDSGSDAIVGATGARATASSLLTPPAGLPSLTKSQSVFAPDGGARAVRGAIITYRLVANFSTATRGAAVDDPIPTGTVYVPGSLVLDDRPLTDAADSDAGTVDAGAIHVTLGDVAATGVRTIQFSVKIQ